jgi:Xaa-Pro aminopeptidase
MANRIAKLADKIAECGLDAYVASRSSNIRYYTGSIGGSHLIVTPDRDPLLLVGVLDENVARDQASDCAVDTYTPASLLEIFADALRGSHSVRVGFDDLPLQLLARIRRRLPEVCFTQNQEEVWRQRMVKDAGEIRLMSEAGRLADVAMQALKDKLAIGATEYELAAEASYAMMREGAEAHSFEFTVGSGPRSAYPHASVTDRKIARGDLIVVDIGAAHGGYCSDITRTFVAGKPDGKKATIYDAVLRSHEAAFGEMKPGAGCREVDGVSRRIIEEAGYGTNYTHSLGHGVGLEIHEPPSVSQRSAERLEAGNVVSDEPGVYIHGYGGVRIEDTVLLTPKGPRRLTNFPRELEDAVF